jgi:hypothetical protein
MHQDHLNQKHTILMEQVLRLPKNHKRINPLNLDEPTTSSIARNDSDTITKHFIQERKDNKVKEVPTETSTLG